MRGEGVRVGCMCGVGRESPVVEGNEFLVLIGTSNEGGSKIVVQMVVAMAKIDISILCMQA